MLLWFAGLAPVLVWQVFRDPAMDFRLVAVGALAPDVVDGVVRGGEAGAAHALVAGVGVLLVVMLLTRGRAQRARRRRWLALPIGMLVHLVLDGMWARAHLFWWPFLGESLGSERLPSFDRPLVVLALQEATGLWAWLWWVRRLRPESA